jgi:hypothetical protein
MSKRFFRRVVLGVFIIFGPLLLGTFLVSKQNQMPEIPQNFQAQEFQTEKKEIQIGIISDTHIPSRVKALPEEIFEIFKGVDLIIHSGDIENLETLKELEKIAKVIAVEGNMDQKETKEKLPEGIAIKIYNWKISIIHSPFSFWLGSHFNFVQEMEAKRLAEKENFDILIFGHTHQPFLKELNLGTKKILLINPGSPTVPFFTQPSVSILKINQQNFEAKIINLPH